MRARMAPAALLRAPRARAARLLYASLALHRPLPPLLASTLRFRSPRARAQADTPFENLGANQPPGAGAPPRSVVFSRDGIFVEGGPAMRKAGTNLI